MTESEVEEQLADALIILHKIEADDAAEDSPDGFKWASLRIAQFALQTLLDPGGKAAKRVTEAGAHWFA